MSGVFPIIHDMCPNSYIIYTGPFLELAVCPKCYKPRYNQLKLANSKGNVKVAHQSFHILAVDPQLQVAWHSVEGSEQMHYRKHATESILAKVHQKGAVNMDIYNDIFWESDYITAIVDGRIKSDDMCLMFSIDGAQLYILKASDCWIYI